MSRFLILFGCISLLYTSLGIASKNYQVDLIVFAHHSGTSPTHAVSAPLAPIPSNAIELKTAKSLNSFQLLSPAKSSLRNEYYLLHRKPQFDILAHYSWLQPATNKRAIELPRINHNGWNIQGTIKIAQNNYYTFDAQLQVSPSGNPATVYIVSQKQRLKGNTVYYFDHDSIGMLVKVH